MSKSLACIYCGSEMTYGLTSLTGTHHGQMVTVHMDAFTCACGFQTIHGRDFTLFSELVAKAVETSEHSGSVQGMVQERPGLYSVKKSSSIFYQDRDAAQRVAERVAGTHEGPHPVETCPCSICGSVRAISNRRRDLRNGAICVVVIALYALLLSLLR